MNHTIMITGYIEPNTEENTAAELDELTKEIENPTIIYNGDSETARKLELFCKERKIAYLHDLERNPRRNRSRMISAEYLIILGHSTRQSIEIMKGRAKYNFLLLRSAQIPPQQDQPRQKPPACYPTGKKATSSRRRRRIRANNKKYQ